MKPGDIIAERFELLRLAGEGGMGFVFQAREISAGKLCALKLLHKAGPQDRRRFEREARVLAELHHPGIVSYIDHGLTPNDEPYLAMEWLEGEELTRQLSHLSPRGLTIRETVSLGRRVAEALAVAHQNGVVHRDIKPNNLFLQDRQIERVKLLDFGIAYLGNTTVPVTRSGMFVGTVGYMAPEQAGSAREVTARADIFSLGCVLFECLTGQPAFSGDRIMAVLAKILFEDAPRASDFRDDLPLPLDDLIARMMSKDPEARPADGAAVAAELASLDLQGGPRSNPVTQRRSSLTVGEQRLVSVILAGPDRDLGAEAVTRTLLPEEVTPPEGVSGIFERVRAGVEPYAAQFDVLVNGSAVATLTSRGIATDQAARAARCALAMRSALGDVPIVLATGRGMFERRSLVGEVIDRAVKLLGSRPENASGIRLDDVTAGLLGRRFDVEGTPAGFELRGDRDTIEEGTYTLLGKPTACVGRESELGMLETLFIECVEEPMARAVLVTGAAGVGKSRLRYEFLRSVRRRDEFAEIWAARGDPIHAGSPFGLLAELLRRATGVLAGEPLEARWEKLRARVESRVDRAAAARVAEFLGEILATPAPDQSVQLRAARQDPALMNDQMRRAWEDFVAAECAAHPVVIVLEDLHWGDLPTVQFIDTALRGLRELPLLVLALARPEIDDLFPRLWVERNVQEIRLGALSRRASERLARQVLGDDMPAPMIDRVVNQAGGNAFYLEELVRAVALGKGDALPETVLAMVQARLEALAAPARLVLRAGSVFGQVFWRGGVGALLGGMSPGAELTALLDREFIARRRSSRFPEEDEFTFRHALVREAAYAMLTVEDRALGHRLAGAWLERAGEQDAMALAEHFERGGAHARAAVFYQRAAEQALDANDLGAVLERAGHAIACGAEGEALGALRRLRAEAHYWRGNLAEAESSGVEAMRLLKRDNPLWFSAALNAAVAAWNRTNYELLVSVVDELRRPVLSSAAISLQLIVMARVVRLLVRSGMDEEAQLLFGRLAAMPEELWSDPTIAADQHGALGWKALVEGDPEGSLEHFKAAEESFGVAGDRRNVLMMQVSAALTRTLLGEYDVAEAAIRSALIPAERMGLNVVTLTGKLRLGRVLLQRGALDEARALEEEMIAVFVAGDSRWSESEARSCLAEILLGMGDLEGAAREAELSARMSEKMLPLRCSTLSVLAGVWLARGYPAEALSAAEEASEVLGRLGTLHDGEAKVRLMLAEARFATGAIEQGRRALAEARERLLARAARLRSEALRKSFLERVPENARTLALAKEWLDDRDEPLESSDKGREQG
jgi:eukaryotic-like serine/threonine-protein kinase